MSDLVEKAMAWDLLVARSTELQARIEELERALENLCIHVGMGWETDEMLEKARAVLKRKP
jgi:hypothetical protein